MIRRAAILGVLAWSWVAAPVAAEIRLTAREAGISGGAHYFAEGDFIGAWRDPAAKLQWDLSIDRETTARVELQYSCAPNCGGPFQLEIGRDKLSGETRSTDNWNVYRPLELGTVKLTRGKHVVTLRAGPFKTAAMNLKDIRLAPAEGIAKTFVPPPLPLPERVFVVPNFHPASCGWLADWSVERNYCANAYLKHLDRVRDDARYALAVSECNNMIAILNFAPERFAELKERIRRGRVEAVNAFFIESTVSLSGGEALAKMGIEGLRWQEKMLGVRPRYCWAIDTCGIHDQIPQLCALLGLDAMAYVRCSRAEKSAFWSESPDGSRILSLNVPSYANNLGGLWPTKTPVTSTRYLQGVAGNLHNLLPRTPAGAPLLVLGGHGDYSQPPARAENPGEFLEAWKKYRPDCEIRFCGPSPFVDALLPGVKSGKIALPSIRAGTAYAYGSFWINCPRVKSWFRRDEHALQAAEMLATAASLKSACPYPGQTFYHAWLQMFLNMDRNSLWGDGAGMVFESDTSWDVKDRLEWVERQSHATLESAARRLAGDGGGVSLFNPVNWRRTEPHRLRLPPNTRIAGAVCEAAGDGTTWCQAEVPAMGVVGKELQRGPADAPRPVRLPAAIDTPYYRATVDPVTGALTSLKARPSGRELLGGPANVVVADKQPEKKSCDNTPPRPKRTRWAGSSDFKTTVAASEGPLTFTVEARGEFVGGAAIRRVTRFFKNHPRIEFETELDDVPNWTVVYAEFPLASAPEEIRRGIPFGFSRDDGYVQGILPAVRWTDYASPGKGGAALLDRGLPGREINANVAVLYLLNAFDKYSGYPNAWTSGKGKHRLEYALVVHDDDWPKARIPQMAWEYNSPVTAVAGCQAAPAETFVETSDNLIVEAMRRDGADIELRLVEALGQAGTGEVQVNLPHTSAARTDLVGGHVQRLGGGPGYKFPVLPQQIITLRCRTVEPVTAVESLTKWDDLVPEAKRPALNRYLPDKVGHPPHDVDLQTEQGGVGAVPVIQSQSVEGRKSRSSIP